MSHCHQHMRHHTCLVQHNSIVTRDNGMSRASDSHTTVMTQSCIAHDNVTYSLQYNGGMPSVGVTRG